MAAVFGVGGEAFLIRGLAVEPALDFPIFHELDVAESREAGVGHQLLDLRADTPQRFTRDGRIYGSGRGLARLVGVDPDVLPVYLDEILCHATVPWGAVC